MLLFVYFLLFLFGLLKAQSNSTQAIIDLVREKTFFSSLIFPEMANSCYFTPFNSSSDRYIKCPTMVKCYLQPYIKKSPNSSSDEFCGPCETIENSLPVAKARQLKAVLRTLRMENAMLCDDDFRFIETFEIFFTNDMKLEQLGEGEGNCLANVSDCQLELNFLHIKLSTIESLPNNSFCQFRQLQILSLNECQLRWIEDNAFVHLINLKALLLPANQLTHLHKDLFRKNPNLQYLDLSENKIQLSALKVFLAFSSLKFLTLNGNRLTSLNDPLTFPSDLEQLEVSENQIEIIGLGLTNLVTLSKLEMSKNNVTEVDENAFRSLTLLNFIDLSENNLRQLRIETFKHNLKLEVINLSWNQLSQFPPLGHLYNLRKLKVPYNQISSIIKSDLLNCGQLSHLDLSYNQLRFIEAGSFHNLRQLQAFNLSHNQLSEMNSNFKSCHMLLELNLDYNDLAIFSFHDIPHSVSQLSITNNRIRSIEAFDFSGQRWNLSSIDLSNNQLVSIEHLQLPPSIQSIDFSSNHISRILSSDDMFLQNLKQLNSVDLTDNNITVLCENQFSKPRLGTIVKYYLLRNPLRCVCENQWLKNVPADYMIELEGSDNFKCQRTSPFMDATNDFAELKTLEDHNFLCKSDYANAKRCQCPNAYEIDCHYYCPYNCTCISSVNFAIVYVMCNDKGFRQIPSQAPLIYNQQDSNVTFELSRNSISRVGRLSLNLPDRRVGTIVVLILSSSKVESIEEKAFDELIGLEKLDLSNNRLQSIPQGLFHNLKQLSHLNLSHNRLTLLADDTISSLSHLQSLYLHSNGFEQLELEPIKGLTFLRNLTLHNNPWSCQCEVILPFKAFLVNTLTSMNKLELKCLENGHESNIPDLEVDHCYHQIRVVALTVSLTFGLCLTVTSLVVFKWRYELQVLVYARYGLRVFHRMEEEVEDNQYDAFVAYNSDDDLFLVHELMPGLETIANPYRLCIHQRDFPVGAVIQDSIMEAIDMSSRTIVLLTANFVKSGWCRFEFKNAHMKMLQDRCPRILLILVGEIPENLDPEMKLYLKTNTYLKWGDKLFWQKLYYAMPDKRVTKPATDIMPMSEF